MDAYRDGSHTPSTASDGKANQMAEAQRFNPSPTGMENSLVQVIEDDAAIRETVAAMLTDRGFRYEAFGSAEEFLASQPATPPACLLLDHKLPGINGLQLQQRLLESSHRLPIVVISGQIEVPEAVRFLQQGATTLLSKPFRADELLAAITAAIELSKVRDKVRQRFDQIGASVEQLTPREKTVLQAIVAGQLNKAIARALDVSVRTIEGDRAKIVDKFGAETTGEVVGKYAQYSLLSEIGGPTGAERVL